VQIAKSDKHTHGWNGQMLNQAELKRASTSPEQLLLQRRRRPLLQRRCRALVPTRATGNHATIGSALDTRVMFSRTRTVAIAVNANVQRRALVPSRATDNHATIGSPVDTRVMFSRTSTVANAVDANVNRQPRNQPRNQPTHRRLEVHL
jgi:hypothetical protein